MPASEAKTAWNRHAPWARAGAVVLLAVALTAAWTGAAIAKPVASFADNGGQETIISDMTTHPSAVRYGTKTWIAYQGTGLDPFICEYDSATGVWAGPFRIGVNLLWLDGHGAPSLWVAPDGNLHVYWGGHNTPMRHARTAMPGTIANWMILPDVMPVSTYPEPATNPDGSLTLFYRDATSVGWVSRTSTNGVDFGPRRRILVRDARTSWYADFRVGASGRTHAAFVRVDIDQFEAGKSFCRYDLYYASADASGTWFDASGSTLPTGQPPVVPETVPVASDALPTAYRCRILNSGKGLVNEVSVREDDTGAPCILALVQTGPSLSEFTWRFWRLEGGTWHSSDIVGTDHFFDAATFMPGPDGRIDAYLVSGRVPDPTPVDNDFTDRGGPIDHYVSLDRGATWALAEVPRITPDESAADMPIVYSDPVMVENGAPGQSVAFADWTQDVTDYYRRLFLWGDHGIVGRDVRGTGQRIAGPRRVQTAVEVSERAFPEGALAVVLATDHDFPDALAGAPLAARLGGPLLLNGSRELAPAVAAEITRLKPGRVVILGTADVISVKVVSQLMRLGVERVERIGGRNRFDTMLGVARAFRAASARKVSRVVLVSGRNWADAASVAPLAAANGWPILLTEPDAPTWQTQTALAELEATSTLVVGGEGAVGATVTAEVPAPLRIGGADRYETSSLLAEWSLSHGMLPDRMLVASGQNFPDALTSASLGQHLKSPLLLTRASEISTGLAGYLDSHRDRITRGFVVGGSDVVNETVWTVIKVRSDLHSTP